MSGIAPPSPGACVAVAPPPAAVGLPPAPRGMPQIEVAFDIDANGIVSVSAKDEATGKEQQIRIQALGGLSQADIERMAREAEQHSAEDKRRRELVEARNPTDAAIYAAERQLQEHGGRVGDTERKSVEDAVAALREAVAGDGIGRIRQRPEALSLALTRLCEAMHRGAAAAGQTAGGPGAGDKPLMGGDDVVDAEFVDVDEPRRHQR